MNTRRTTPSRGTPAATANGLLTLGRVAPACMLVAVALCGGCRQAWIDSADREVANLIEQRQRAAMGFTADAGLGAETGELGRAGTIYDFIPSAIDAAVPEPFRRATAIARESATDDSAESTPSADDAAKMDQPPRPFALADALAYAMRNARRYQSEKEELYLSALDLTLERYLWSPRFVSSVLGVEYDNLGQTGDFDQTLAVISDFAIQQRLPHGGEVTARVINTLMRDISRSVTDGESGQAILDARLPLLRGSGPVAYENRYRAERRLVYAVRDFERFRREFLTDIAGEFFNLLSLKAQISSAEAQAASLAGVYQREQALADAGRILQIEADRARVSMLNAENRAIVSLDRYETSVDRFKIRVGMPTREPIDVLETKQDLVDPKISTAEASETALKYRLDLLNARDFVDDARRGVKIARNNLLPQVDLSGRATMNTDANRGNATRFESRRTQWRADLSVEIPLDRKSERNDYRSALIFLRRAERNRDEFVDTVRLEVRAAKRRLETAQSSIDIQREQIRINEIRKDLATTKLEAGQLPSNRDVVDAEEDLSRAKNDFAAAISDYRRAVLQFLRDTGTLRIGDDGRWIRYDSVSGEPLPSEATPADAAPAGP